MLGEEYVECNAIVNGLKDGNYYAAETDEQLKSGSSGGPVFLNGEVVGIYVLEIVMMIIHHATQNGH